MKTSLLFVVLIAFSTIAHAQTNDMTPSTSTQNTTGDNERRGFDPGWLGLLGLVGLAGLWRKNEGRDSLHSSVGTAARV